MANCPKCAPAVVVHGRTRIGLAPLALFLLASPQLAHAQSAQDRFWAEGSWYWPSADTSVLVEDRNQVDPPREISLEDDLGFETDDSLPSFVAGAKLGNGFRVIGEYFEINRSAEAELDKEIGFGRFKFEVNADVESSFKTKVYRVGLGWDFLDGDNYALGVFGGLHATNFAIRLEGEATVDGNSVGVVNERRDALAPLPTVGAYGLIDILPNLTLNGRADYIDLTLNNAGGRILNAEATLVYYVTPNIGVGVGYRHVDYKLEMVKRDWIGSIDYKFNGPKVTLRAAIR